MRRILITLASVAIAAAASPAAGQPKPAAKPLAPAKITWLGHAAFRIETPSGKTVLVDPWLQNPANPSGKDDVKTTKADLILVTHGHSDHVGDSVEIAKRTKAKLVATFDLGNALVAAGFPKDQFGMETGGNFGGTLKLLDGEVTVTFVPAVHSSNVGEKAGGNPGGFLITVRGGGTIYHTGDTDVFNDMSLIGKLAKVDLMLPCIGGHFTMDPVRAAEAVRLVKPKQTWPMHYGTFPALAGTPADLAAALKKTGTNTKLVTAKIGETIQLSAPL